MKQFGLELVLLLHHTHKQTRINTVKNNRKSISKRFFPVGLLDSLLPWKLVFDFCLSHNLIFVINITAPREAYVKTCYMLLYYKSPCIKHFQWYFVYFICGKGVSIRLLLHKVWTALLEHEKNT